MRRSTQGGYDNGTPIKTAMRAFDRAPRFIRDWLNYDAPAQISPVNVCKKWRKLKAEGWTKAQFINLLNNVAAEQCRNPE